MTEAGGPGADDVREFLRWAKNRGLTGELTMPVPVPREALTALEQDEHWHQLRRALTEATLPLDVRAAAALALLYGVAFSRIQHLRRDEVEERPDGVYWRWTGGAGTGCAWPNRSGICSGATYAP